jgi:hypothetical protein
MRLSSFIWIVSWLNKNFSSKLNLNLHLWAICLRLSTHCDSRILVRYNITVTYEIHEGFKVPFFADSIREFTEIFDLKFADVGNPLFQHNERHLYRTTKADQFCPQGRPIRQSD